jgi:hypothetical protein
MQNRPWIKLILILARIFHRSILSAGSYCASIKQPKNIATASLTYTFETLPPYPRLAS